MKTLIAIVLGFAVFGLAARAWAHSVGLSKGEYVLEETTLRAEMTFARGELIAVVPTLDVDGDGFVEPSDVDAASAALAKAMTAGVVVRADGKVCPGAFTEARVTEEDGITLGASYTCASRPSRLELHLRILGELSAGHRHIAHVVMGPLTVDDVASVGHDVIEVSPPGLGSSASRTVDGLLAFVRLGAEHVLSGYDHVVFLIGLVLVGGRARSLVGVVTSFTVAHSVTLAMAALGVWAPPSRVIEPMIALSIVYVGVENFFVRSAENRWRVTFPFGLVHGFGFAGALRDVEIPRERLASALVLFNTGVEVGQLAVIAAVLPLVLILRKQPGFVPRGVAALSGAVALTGAFWFVERLWRAG